MRGYEYVAKWNPEFRDYAKTFDKYGISLSKMANMQEEIDEGNFNLSVTIEYFHRTPSGRWQAKPYSSETREINAEFYMNCITSIPCFKDRVTRSYTKWGYIPTRMSCVSWGTANTKAVREFHFS